MHSRDISIVPSFPYRYLGGALVASATPLVSPVPLEILKKTKLKAKSHEPLKEILSLSFHPDIKKEPLSFPSLLSTLTRRSSLKFKFFYHSAGSIQQGYACFDMQ